MTSEQSKLCAGFTFIELIVVIAITGMLSGILIIYSTRSRSQITLYVEAAKVTQILMRAKSLALSTYSLPVVPCGYGVSFGYGGAPPVFDGTYEIFSYNPLDCGSIASAGIDTASSSYRRIGERYSVDTKTIKIDRHLNPAPRSLRTIFYIPPGPTVLYWDVVGPGLPSNGGVYLQTLSLPAASRTILLNSQGQITL